MATLYLMEQGSVVKLDGDTLVVHIPANEEKGTERRKVRIPLVKVEQVVAYGKINFTAPARTALLEQGVDVCYCTQRGRFLGWLMSPFSKNGLLRIEQHRAHNDPVRSFTLAQAFVLGKLQNMRTMLMRANRKRGDAEIARAIRELKGVMGRVIEMRPEDAGHPQDPSHPQAGTMQGSLMGLEGVGTSIYFSVFGRLLDGDWEFRGREKRPPRDPINALLSFGYTLLTNQALSAVSIVGLDPYVGFLHSSQYGKPALALDVIEPFRPLIVDSVVLTLLNNGMLKRSDFQEEFGAWRLTDKGRRIFLSKFEERLNTEIRHPVFKYKATYRRCLELEVRLVAKWLMGEIPRYKPFVVR